jgi:hypothetical protein
MTLCGSPSSSVGTHGYLSLMIIGSFWRHGTWFLSSVGRIDSMAFPEEEVVRLSNANSLPGGLLASQLSRNVDADLLDALASVAD